MNRIKELRKEHSVTQKTLAEAIGVSEKQIARYEKEEQEPKRSTYSDIAEFFDVSVPYVMGLSNFKKDEIIKKLAEDIQLKGIEAKIPPEFTDDDTANLEIKYLISKIEHISSNTDMGKRYFLINIMRTTLDIYELMDKFIDDKPYEDFEILFDKFKNLISKVTDNNIVTGNFYEQLADFDDEIKEFYTKNKDN